MAKGLKPRVAKMLCYAIVCQTLSAYLVHFQSILQIWVGITDTCSTIWWCMIWWISTDVLSLGHNKHIFFHLFPSILPFWLADYWQSKCPSKQNFTDKWKLMGNIWLLGKLALLSLINQGRNGLQECVYQQIPQRSFMKWGYVRCVFFTSSCPVACLRSNWGI